MKIKFMALAMIALTFVACNSTKTTTDQVSGNQALMGTWNLATLNGKTISALEHGRVINLTLSEENNHASGFAGCNNFMGSYTLDGSNLEFSPMATTRKACRNQDFNEQDFLSIFSEVTSYKIKDGQLRLLNTEKQVIATFNKDNSANIVNKHWKLKTLNGKTVKMSENQQKERFFTLKKENHKVAGFAGCNTFMGSYSLDANNQIDFSQMAATLKACPDSDVRDSDLLSALHNATHYEYHNDSLTLFDSEGTPLATFEAIYF